MNALLRSVATTSKAPACWCTSTALTRLSVRPASDNKNAGKQKRRKKKKVVEVDPSLTTIADAAMILKAMVKGRDGSYELFLHFGNENPFLNALRGRVFLPHPAQNPSAKEVSVVFATGKAAEAAKAAGADFVGGTDLANEILEGRVLPTKVISSPEALSIVTGNRTLAKFLGPKGLMPSMKRGTVTSDMTTALREAKGGLDWRANVKSGVIETVVARVHQQPTEVEANILALVADVQAVIKSATETQKQTQGSKVAPSAIRKVYLKTSKGPRIQLITANR